MATASPPIDIRLTEPPNTCRNRNVGMTAMGSVIAAIMVKRRSRRKTISTMIARNPPMRIASRTFAMANATNSPRSYTLVMRSPAGSVCARSASVCSTPARKSRMFAPICCEMLSDTASRPFAVTSRVRSGAPCVTCPRSARRIVAPSFAITGVAEI